MQGAGCTGRAEGYAGGEGNRVGLGVWGVQGVGSTQGNSVEFGFRVWGVHP